MGWESDPVLESNLWRLNPLGSAFSNSIRCVAMEFAGRVTPGHGGVFVQLLECSIHLIVSGTSDSFGQGSAASD